jgi:hypothetical protein
MERKVIMKIDNTSSKIMFSVVNIGENKVCEYNHYVSLIYSNIINLRYLKK